VTRIQLETFVAAPPGRGFDLARDIGFHERSMARTGERAVGGRITGRIAAGETVTLRARHFGRSWTLTTRIVEMSPPRRFVDEQLSGPFRRFRHVHAFVAAPGGTRVIDDWVHEAPFGPVGWLADRLVLARHLRRLLIVRNAALKAEAEAPS